MDNYRCDACGKKPRSKQDARRKTSPRKRTRAMRDDELIKKNMKHFGLKIIPFRALLKKAKLTPIQEHVLGNVAPPNRWRIATCVKWGLLGRGCDPSARGQM